MIWFVVAIVYMGADVAYTQMQRPFHSEQECQKFYLENKHVREDVIKLYPNQTGHTLVCITGKEVLELQRELLKSGREV